MFYNIAIVIVRIAVMFVFRLRFVGRENVPAHGGVIVAFNHRSNWDPIMAGLSCRRQLCFMAKEELFKNPVFGGLIKSLGAFPVSRGKSDISSIKAALRILSDGKAMLMFPEGHRIKNNKKVKAKPGVAMIAQRARVPVVPVCISGEYKWMRKITVTYGKPMTFEEYYGKKSDQDQIQLAADKVLEEIRKLNETHEEAVND